MTDKYEEFKKWCFEGRLNLPVYMQPYFREFEKEQKEIEREKQVKETIKNSIDKLALEKCGIGWINVDIIYKDLKEKDLLK